MKLKLLFIVVSATFLLSVLGTAVYAQEELPSPYAGLKTPFPSGATSAQESGKISPPEVLPPSESEPSAQLECLSCHPTTLEFHDKLGSGNKACWVCHDSSDMEMLRLVDGTLLSSANSPQLCQQCHQKRYEAWSEGTHGIPAWKGVSVEIDGAQRVGCTSCHDPHQPQVALLGITKPHPLPAPPPPPSPVEPLIILGISLLLVMGVGIVVVVTRGEGP